MSELGELYASMTLKSLGLSLVAVFVPVYFYELGFSVSEIALYYALYFLLRTPFNFVAGELSAKYGPKHIIAYSYVFLLFFLALLITMPTYLWPLWLVGLVHVIFNSLFFVPYHIDFSKVHDGINAGKQLSIMNILVRSAAALGPFVGGMVATWFGINVTLALAALIVLLAILPLMMTSETVKTNHKPDYKSYDFKKNLQNMVAYSGYAIQNQITLTVWPLYISVFIFSAHSVYADVGFVTSAAIAMSLIMARIYGHIVDNNAGGKLLRFSSFVLAAVHLARSTVRTMAGVLAINISAELANTGGLIALTKGFYNEADRSKDRIAYITISEAIVSFVRALLWLFIFVATVKLGDRQGLILSFYLAALFSLLINLHNFKALK